MDKTNDAYNRWMESPSVSDELKETLKKMSKSERDDAFFRDIEFGTAGMRGVLGPGTNRLNEFTVKKATVAFGYYLLKTFPDAKERGVAISHDNRYFSREFTLESARLLNELGIKSYIFDSLRPTPELSFAVRRLHACGGIMITASHNPKEYNGYKVYDENGCQLVPERFVGLLEEINKLPDELSIEFTPAAVKGENIILDSQIDDEYVALVEGTQINPDLPKKGFKIVYSPQHGTSYENAIRVFKDCGYEVIPVLKQCNHDSNFGGTKSPNPENPEAYEESIKLAEQYKAHLIVMTDPDGDRVGVAYRAKDGSYRRFTGNQSAALLIDYILSERRRKGTLPKDGVMYDTVVTSDLGRKIAASYGLSVESFLTGFKFIGDRIAHYEKEGKGPEFVFGYEESYGCLISPFVRDKDGIQAILLYCEMALWHHLGNTPLDLAYNALLERYGGHYSFNDSLEFTGSDGAEKMKSMMDALHKDAPKSIAGTKVARVEDYFTGLAIDENGKSEELLLPKSEVVKIILEDGSWVAIRPSGTEPKIKFYVEAVAEGTCDLEAKAKELSKNIKKELGIR